MTLSGKFGEIKWGFVVLVAVLASIGFAMLFAAGGDSLQPWALPQIARFAIGMSGLIIVAMIDIRSWLRYAYLIYAVALALVLATQVVGFVGMGARRWIDLGFIQMQPSEAMKVALVLALARYFHITAAENVNKILYLLPPVGLMVAPALAVMAQPDLGTGMMLMLSGAAMFFLAGVRLRYFVAAAIAAAAAVPVAWHSLHEYQRERVMAFLDPESDPLGTGYHIIQSKIALGSGALFGKGYMQGTQSHLNFLPEKQTDFIFTMLAEEFGLTGALTLLLLYLVLIAYGVSFATQSRNHFGRLLAMGITTMLFLYVFINMAMVMGLIPVVGVPLPLISYGGTAMLTLLFSLGLVLNVSVHRDVRISRRGADG